MLRANRSSQPATRFEQGKAQWEFTLSAEFLKMVGGGKSSDAAANDSDVGNTSRFHVLPVEERYQSLLFNLIFSKKIRNPTEMINEKMSSSILSDTSVPLSTLQQPAAPHLSTSE
jgi:hypothetical protein